MSLPNLRLLSGLLASLLVGSTAQAQIHEEKPLPGLEEGVLIDVQKDGISSANTPVPRKGRPGDKDFSIIIEVGIKELTDAALFWDFDWGRGWDVDLKADGSVQFTGKGASAQDVKITTPPHAIKPHQAHTIVVSIKRNARQPESGIWIDGIEVASGAVPPEDCGGFTVCRSETEKLSSLRVRQYNRALTRSEILELTLRGSGTTSDKPKPKHPEPPPNGPRFIPQPDETIALIGGTEAVALAESGELEALLLMAFPQTKFHFRSLAWEGDTVFRQDRPLNFGSLEQQLRRVNAGAVFVMFGRQECLDAAQATTRSGAFATADQKHPRSGKTEASGSAAGAEGVSAAVKNTPLLGEFETAFGKLLDTVAKVTPNIVVIAPPPFQRMPAPLPNLGRLNQDLSDYSDAVRAIARSYEHAFVGGGPDDEPWDGEWPFTVDGVSLNDIGRFLTASKIAHDLLSWRETMGAPESLLDRLQGNQQLTAREAIQKELQAKNRLWHDYWRPSNWAFLHGDRTTQPSSRDPVNPQVRLFPAEQEKYLPLIKEAEDKIFQLVQEAQKKVP